MITNSELFILLALTLALMVLFFPKNMIENAIEEEKSNYDLTLIYLKSIAAAYPDDPQNWRRLLDAELKMGDTADAEKIFQKLDTRIKMTEEERAFWNYRLLKDRYERSKGPQKEQIKKLLLEKLHRFLNSRHPSRWYLVMEEARDLNMPKLRFEALKKSMLHTTLVDETQLQEALTLATQLGREKDLKTILHHIASIAPDEKMRKTVEDHYLATQDYAGAARFFEACFQQSSNSDALLKSMRYYFWAKKPQKALFLLDSNKTVLLKDPKTAEAVIKLLLENNRLKEAKSFTLETLKKQKVLP